MAGFEVTQQEVRLILDALQDALFYRDARAHVFRGMVRRADRRRADHPADPGDAGDVGDAGDEHRAKAQAYAALASRLKAFAEPRP